MANLKSIETKTIKEFERSTSGENTTLKIVFEDGARANIVAYPNGDTGVAQLNVETNGLKVGDIIGKRVNSIIEEFDGEVDKYIIILDDKKKVVGKIIVNAFGSSEELTAGISISIHLDDVAIKESTYKINKFEMKLVAESLQEAIDFEMEHPLDKKARLRAEANSSDEGDDGVSYYQPKKWKEDLAAVGIKDADGNPRYRPDSYEDDDDESFIAAKLAKAAHEEGVAQRREARRLRRERGE